MASAYTPILIVGSSIAVIAVAIGWFRVHAFLALMAAAVFVGLLTAAGASGTQRFNKAVEQAMTEFGNTAGKVGFAIALAAIIGACLMESGAADRVVLQMIAVMGERRAALGLLACSFILAAPVFVDTVFLLLLPLARALSLRTGRDFMLYVLVIGSGAVISNGVVPPAPGPLLVAETLKLELGHAIIGGIAFGILPAVASYFVAKWFNRKFPATVRPLDGSTEIVTTPEPGHREPPLFWISIAPLAIPLALIAASAIAGLARARVSPGLLEGLQFFGNKNVALSIGALIAVSLLLRQRGSTWRDTGRSVVKPIEVAGSIILIVSAGGAYGAMINHSGVGDAIRSAAGGHVANQVFFAWAITVVIRAALGSATVATITGVGVMASLAGPLGFGVHPLYILLAIGFGSKCLPWMNDAGFWVVSRVSGLTQGEMLRTWTPALSILSVIGLIEVLIVSAIWPTLQF